jgi:hypothetical protein
MMERDECGCDDRGSVHAKLELVSGFDLDDLIMSTTSYYLGRTTANVSEFCRALVESWARCPQPVQSYVRKVVESAFERDDFARRLRRESGDQYGVMPLGHDMDREAWSSVRKCWQ